ncbi:SRPBCC family protein [Georgenia sp. SUBG003]|uniref:SRPBCC family protein n=1 Tax=Georgenia sp. SUBG003 TaxID=1497974 RepID=UPI0004D4707F|nr:hypothetical protein DA06_00160 [Georgenia sp. SUBG003]
MRRWFQRDYHPLLDGGGGEIVEVSASVDVRASRQSVWSLIKPAENGPLLSPHIVRGFHVPGTPEGVGEIQGFITVHDGRKHFVGIELVAEVPEQLAVTRVLGTLDDASRSTYALADIPGGCRFEQRERFTVPPGVDRTALVRHHQDVVDLLAQRVKHVAEQPWTPYPAVADGRTDQRFSPDFHPARR